MESLQQAAFEALMTPDPDAKAERVGVMVEARRSGRLAVDPTGEPRPVPVPGRPVRPELVAPARLPRRRIRSREGLIGLLHALTHIEFNAINLALDAVYRFRDLPEAFHDDWLRVAAEEAYHFRLLRERLRALGADYGDLPAHNGLWEMACRTAHDPLVRMALVPRVLEARGLDVTPGMMERLRGAGEGEVVAALEVILRDEVGHVAIGTRWFRYCCERRGVAPEETFFSLLGEYMTGPVKGPFHHRARREAGFTGAELARLEELAR